MIKKVFFFALIFSITTSAIAQNLNDSWQIGAGIAITRFSTDDANFIGDQHIFQAPRLNMTMPVGERFSIDGAISFNTFEPGFIKNSVKYFSMDGSVRYNFDPLFENFAPYVFAGGSIVDSELKMTPTLNIGAGGIYWINQAIGINPQLYYKHSFEAYSSMRSHIQGTLGVVFRLNWDNIFIGGNHAARSSKGRMHCF
ncbi:conserved exported protein of unknown function [Tenacibaculum sp. 190130A14a]|uniref:Outer membrane protein beta-barrel domain-containing protein n=1 Tax=Tenacibaculum polynesiense TaxID=3137857 RepID=A0ABM9PE85_9FLAO